MGIKSTLGKNLTGLLSLNNTSNIGVTADNVLPILASGGVGITTTGHDGKATQYHVFTEPGHFRLGSVAVGTGKTFTVLMVGGGGAGGGAYYAGGGGAGEVVYGADVEFPLSEGYDYKVEIGAGAMAVRGEQSTSYDSGTNGQDTRFYPTINYTESRLNGKSVGIVTTYQSNVGLGSTGVMAMGGGGGGSYSGAEYMYGNSGGSGGGSSYYITPAIYPARYTKSGANADLRGYNEQYVYYGNSSDPGGNFGHGAGGAGAVGSDADGGAGKSFQDFGHRYILPAIPTPISDSFVTALGPTSLYGGGGGGSAYGSPDYGVGGAGGGGNGGDASMDGTPGTDYTGGGGGGAQLAPQSSGAGGKGIVIIKYII